MTHLPKVAPRSLESKAKTKKFFKRAGFILLLYFTPKWFMGSVYSPITAQLLLSALVTWGWIGYKFACKHMVRKAR